MNLKYSTAFLYIIFLINFLYLRPVSAVEAGSYDELKHCFCDSDDVREIDITDDLEANSDLGIPGKSVTVCGNGHSINGCGYSGIYLDNKSELVLDSVCAENFSGSSGGFIYNASGCVINIVDSAFNNNFCESDGGVIFNDSSIGNITGSFSDNTADKNGGAIFNNITSYIESIEGSFSNNTTLNSMGGAISSFGDIGDINGIFDGNKADGGSGGAVANMGDIRSLKGTFRNNYAKEAGGAVYNSGIIENLDGVFENNHADKGMLSGGGAVMNFGTIQKLSGIFENNSTQERGGAISNMMGTINIVSDENETIFRGNKDSTGSNAIYNDGGIINFNAGEYDITIDDRMSGSTIYGLPEININKESENLPNGGRVIINNSVSENTVNMYGGTLKFGNFSDGETESFGNFDNSVNFNYYGGLVDLRNNNIQNTNLGCVTLNNDMELKIDGDFAKQICDTITAGAFSSNNYHMNITDIFLMTPTDAERISFCPFGSDMDADVLNEMKKALIYTGGDVINSPIYRYNAYYDSNSGLINFVRLNSGDIFSPEVLATPIASQLGGYLTQINSYFEAFRHMDKYLLLPYRERISLLYSDKYAASDGNLIFNPLNQSPEKIGWLSPYTFFERVPLKNGPKVSNISYGSFFGGESDLIKMRHGWNVVWGPYIGYNGSVQTYDSVRINQNGGTLGAVAMGFKDKWYLGLTANAGSNGCETNTVFGKDLFSMIMAGTALKFGYNKEFADGKFVLQPNCLMSYSYINTFNYKNSAGVNLNSKPLNAIQIAPGIQFFANMKEGFQPFLGVYMIWNILDKTRVRANDISLPELAVEPFVMYGCGVRKFYSQNSSGFLQVYVANGGRNGVGIQFGYRRFFGN